VTAIIFGLLTAVFFATSTLCNSRAVKHISSWSVVAWAMTVGIVINIPILIIGGIPHLTGATVGWLLVCGLGNVVGLILAAFSFRVGKVGVVAPIIATEGAIAAVLAFAFGQPIVPLVIVTLAVVVIGVVLSSVAPDPAPIEHERPHLAVVLALVCAASFGLSLYATGHLSGELPLGLVMLPPRLTGVVLLAIPLAASRRLQITRRTAPLVVTMGIAEVIGYICLTIASRDDVAVASVLVSQFAPIAAVVAFLLFKERLGRLQIAGLVVIIIGVVGLSIVQTTT
jgi:drug/metabolite transporter (DMT)-like permease